ncbi:MAG: ABC transporter substrate-binding protein [Bacillus sp. (in: firmicutes)]
MKHSNKLLIFLLASLLLLVSACGNKKEEVEQEKEEPVKTTFTYTADNGMVEVPKDPKKIVVLEASYVGYLLQLGIQPVAVQKLALDNPYFKDMLTDTEEVTSDALEQIMILEPDLIITGTTDENIPALQDIAPTVAFEWGKRDYLEKMTALGEVVSRKTEAAAWLSKWEEKVSINKEKVQEAVGDKTISIMESSSNGVYVFGDNFGRGGEIIYDALELKAPQKVQEDVINKNGFAEVPLESIPGYAGDYIYFRSGAGEEASNDRISKSTIWQSLPAVKNGDVFILDERTSYFSDPITLDKVMDKVVKDLTNKQ